MMNDFGKQLEGKQNRTFFRMRRTEGVVEAGHIARRDTVEAGTGARSDRGSRNDRSDRSVRGGFTLVELIVTMVILAMLAAVSVGAMMTYQTYSIYKKNDEYARSIFNAAQASLARSRASGTLEALEEDLLNLLEEGASGVGDEKECGILGEERSKMYYLMMDKTAYDTLEAAGSDTAAGLLYEILSPYLLDGTIFDASICVELDPTDGVVQGVFYCDRADSLVYGESSGSALGLGAKGSYRADEGDNRSYRRRNGLGYYGTDTSETAPGTMDRLVISNVELVNGETLDLTWTLKKSQMNDTATSDYVIRLFENTANVEYPRVEITLLGSLGTLVERDESNTMTGQVTFYDTVTGETAAETELEFDCYMEQSASSVTTVHLVLDAVDLDLTDQTLAGLGLAGAMEGDTETVLSVSPYEVLRNLYGEMKDGVMTDPEGTAEAAALLTGSYSIRRLGLDFDQNIYATVQANNVSYRESKERTSNKEQPLFDNLTVEKGTDTGTKENPAQYTVEIANARHLFNASFEEEAQAYVAVSETTAAEGAEGSDGEENSSVVSKRQETVVYRSMQYLQTSDFIWSSQTGEGGEAAIGAEQGILEKGHVYGSSIVLDEHGAATDQKNHIRITQVADPLPAFHSFELLHQGNTYDGNGKTITGLIYDHTQLPDAAVGEGAAQTQTWEAAGERLGFIRSNSGTVQDLTLADCQVRGATQQEEGENLWSNGTDYVGAFCGKLLAGGSLINCEVSGGTVTGRSYVGGLAGAMDLTELAAGQETQTGSGTQAGAESRSGTQAGAETGRGTQTGAESGRGTQTGAESGSVTQTVAETGTETAAAIRESENSARISGYAYVGGILGGTWTEQEITKIEILTKEFWNSIEQCENTGAVRALNFSDDTRSTGGNTPAGEQKLPQVSACFGGVAGLSRYLRIAECSSAPQLSEEEMKALEGTDTSRETTTIAFEVEGDFVGGIAGYSCQGSIIENCSTGEGYVIGRNFVGGIVGMYEGAQDSQELKGEWQSRYCENQAHVLGENFVGGITAANADLPEEYDLLYLSITYDEEGDWIRELTEQAQMGREELLEKAATPETAGLSTIRGWVNRGVVAGSGSYAGGITGFNTGILSDCQCEINTAAALEAKRRIAARQGGETARYVGGLAGYNNGTITVTDGSTLHVVAVASGRSFVGGLVGYQDVDGTLQGYYLDGGYIEGISFVGGAIGLNYSTDILESRELICNPNVVTGDYFTGGILGANFAVVEENRSEPLALVCNTDNFLGTVGESAASAQAAFTGGFIGANMLLQHMETGTEADWESTAQLTELMLALLPRYEAEAETAEQYSSRVQRLTELMDTMDVETLLTELASSNPELAEEVRVLAQELKLYAAETAGDSVQAMRISGSEDAALINHLNSVSGGVYVGGIMGYNSQGTSLLLSYIENRTAVTANQIITDPQRAARYSQGRKTASGAAMTDREGTELTNETVQFAYAGGIIGLVTGHTVVDHCGNRLQGRVSGNGTYQGSVAEVNEGTITNCNTGSVGTMTSAYVGGIVGINGICEAAATDSVAAGGSTEGSIPAVIAGCTVDGIIRGTSYVGGIAAENYGIIEGYGSGDTVTKNRITGSISGTGSYVGGIAGKTYDGAAISNAVLVAGASVGGSGSCVGGIVGGNTGAIAQLVDIETEDGASVTGNADVGGIVGRQEADVSGLTDTQTVSAVSEAAGSAVEVTEEDLVTEVAAGLINRAAVTAYSGNAGGIVGTAEARLILEECENYGNVEAQQSGDAGGIVSQLQQVDSELTGCESHGNVTARNGRAGGITAVNNGQIAGCSVGGASAAAIMQVTGRLSTGGICGENGDGTTATDSTNGTGSTGSSGGTNGTTGTGSTNGTTGTGSSAQGGRILAAASDSGESRSNRIQNLTVTNVTGSSSTSLGGVAGINRGVIEAIDCRTGANVTVQMQAEGSRVGGLAGWNQGEASRIGAAEETAPYMEISGILVSVDGKNGNVGGIAGENEGQILSITSSTPEKLTFVGGSGYGYGGIAGINRAGGQIRRCRVRVQMQVAGDANAIASMGGAAGINEENAAVEQVQVLAGTHLSCTNNSYLGGVVGMNLGTVADCLSDTVKTEANQTEEINKLLNPENINYSATYYTMNNRGSWQKELASAANMVYIINAKGNTGGIVGVMGNPSSKKEGLHATVTNCSTGSNWYVMATNHDTDNACGGIIGYSYGVEAVSDLVNYAAVAKRASSANSAGGIIGRWENEEGARAVLNSCENFGTVDAKRAGGIIGQLKYNGAILRSCKNWGEIYSEGESAAGLIASFYATNGKETVLAEDCGNYGTIYSKEVARTGGFFGTNTHGTYSSGYTYTFRNCVNAGDICTDKAGTAGGFMGSGFVNTTQQYERCRNFGYGYANWNKTSYNTSFTGITQNTGAKLQDCFGVANPLNGNGTAVFAPLTLSGNKNVTNSYFLAGEYNQGTEVSYEGVVESTFSALKQGVTEESDNPLKNMVDGNYNTSDTLSGNNRYVLDATNNFNYSKGAECYAQMRVIYQQVQQASRIEIHFTYGSDRWKAYILKVGYRTENGGEIKWLDGSAIASGYQEKLVKAGGGLYYDSEAELFSFYQAKNYTNFSITREEAVTAYFTLTENTSLKEIVVEVYGEYQNNNNQITAQTSVKNSNYLLTKESALSYVNNSCPNKYITVTEICRDGGNKELSAPVEGDPLANVVGTPMYYTLQDEQYRWAPKELFLENAGAALGSSTVTTVNPNAAEAIEKLKVLSGEARWSTELTKDANGNELETSTLEVLDQAINDWYETTDTETKDPVTSVGYQGAAGGFTLNWSCAGNPSYYEIQLLYGDGQTAYTGRVYDASVKNLLIPVQSSWMNGVALTAQVRAVYGTTETDWRSCSITFDYFLENADVSLRLVNISGSASEMYQVLLENYHSYEQVLKEGDKLVLSVWTGNNEENSFYLQYDTTGTWSWSTTEKGEFLPVGAGGALGTVSCKGDTNESISTQVQVNGNYSTKNLVQTTAPTQEMFQTKKPSSVGWSASGLQGASRNGQSYQIRNLNPGDYQNRQRGEFVVLETKNGISVPVVVSTAVADLSAYSNNQTMELTGLPESFSTYLVRIYPWAGKNSVVTYHYYELEEDADGNAVQKTFTWDDLFGTGGVLHDIAAESGYQPGDTEAAGYVLEAAGTDENGEALYYLIHSELFKGIDGDTAKKVQTVQILYETTAADGSHWKTITARSAPMKLELLQNQADLEEGSTLIRWKLPETLKEGENSDYQKNSFELILTGYETRESTEGVRIYQKVLDAQSFIWDEAAKTYGVILTAAETATWNYQKVSLEVICQGQEDANGKLTWMPSETVTEGEAGLQNPKEFTWLLQLDQISAPTVQSPADKNGLVYTVIWSGVAAEQRNFLERYEVYVSCAADGVQEEVCLGTVERDAEDQIATRLDVDLDAYEGQAVSIYVKAIARAYDGYSQYRDSLSGKETDLQIPSRLPVADQVLLDHGYTADDTDVVTEQSFLNNGILLTAGVTGDGADRIKTGVSFSYQAGLYQLTDAQYQALTGTDAGTSDVDWKSGQRLSSDLVSVDTENYTMGLTIAATGEVVAAAKSFGADAEGSSIISASAQGTAFRQGSLTGLQTSQAATYLLVRFRTISNSDISSRWSEYYLLRLPKVELEAPQIQIGSALRKWTVTRTETLVAGKDGTAGASAGTDAASAGQSSDDAAMIVDTSGTETVQQEVENQTISWTQQTDSQVSGYEVTIHRSRVEEETNPEDLSEEERYDYDQYPKDYPEMKFCITENPDSTDTAHPFVIQTEANRPGQISGSYPLTLSETGNGSTTWEVYLDEFFYTETNDWGEEFVYEPPYYKHFYEYVYADTYDTSEGTVEETYSMMVKTAISVTRAQNGTLTYTVTLPDLLRLNSMRVMASAAVEVQAMTEDGAGKLVSSGDQFTASKRKQWMLRVILNRDNTIADYVRTLPEGTDWFANLENDIAGGNYQWVKDYSVYAIDNGGNILYRYECTGEKPYYQAEHKYKEAKYVISGLPFVAATQALTSMLAEPGELTEAETETAASEPAASEPADELIIDPEEDTGDGSGDGSGDLPGDGSGDLFGDGSGDGWLENPQPETTPDTSSGSAGEDVILEEDGLLFSEEEPVQSAAPKAGSESGEAISEETMELESLTAETAAEETIELESLTTETAAEETIELESLAPEMAVEENESR